MKAAQKTICLYSPYVPGHFGGGERYFFDVASQLSLLGHSVSIAIPQSYATSKASDWDEATTLRQEYERFLGLDLSAIEWRLAPLSPENSWLERWNWTRQFDVMYYVTDGSFFVSGAKRNIVHIQIPFTQPLSFPQRVKLATWHVVNTNSEFTRNVIIKHWGVKPQFVHHPMIGVGVNATPEVKPALGLSKREKSILSVGRFFRQLHHKRHDVMIQMFEQLRKSEPQLMKGWKLVLVGGVEDREYVAELQDMAEGLPVEFVHDVSRKELLKLYQEAAVYWHAAGHGVDETFHPESVEHFGISTVEAMASGAVPIVINKGGQKEVMGKELKELMWDSVEQAVGITTHVLSDASYFETMQQKALDQARIFSPQAFSATLEKMIG